MCIYEVIWKDQFLDKIESKHAIDMNEVEDVLFGQPLIRRSERGRIKGEDLYVACGQTGAGRYLIVFSSTSHLLQHYRFQLET